MTAADQIRALADTGTPGPWRYTDSETVNDVWQAGLTIVGVDGDPIANIADEWYEPEGQDEDATPFYDAAKIVAAVNALPHIADLIDTIDNQPGPYIACADPDCKQATCTITRARDALVEALGVTP
jgi:hypothetical protein